MLLKGWVINVENINVETGTGARCRQFQAGGTKVKTETGHLCRHFRVSMSTHKLRVLMLTELKPNLTLLGSLCQLILIPHTQKCRH